MPTQYCECGAKYRFPDSAVGKRAKCKKCGTILVLRAELDDGTLAIAPEEPSPAPTAHSQVDSISAAPQQGKIFKSPAPADTPPPRGTVESAPAADGKRGYWSDVLWTFLFPANPSSLITFLVIWGFMTVAPLVACVPLIGFFLVWVVAGWFAAFQFEVLGSAAAGEDDIPQPSVESGMVPELLAALLKWGGSWILVMLPALGYLLWLSSQGRVSGMDAFGILSNGVPGMLQGPDELTVFKALVCAGVFFWPIVVLCVAVDSFDVVYRVDLLTLTIIRTFPIYLVTLLLMFAAVAAESAIGDAVVAAAMTGQGGGGIVGSGLVLHVVGTGLHVYMSIVVMRLIGLYYVYGKKRFAWSWE